MSNHERYEHGLGPIYTVPLIDSLPLNPENASGTLQQMPTADDLKGIKDYRQGQRVVAGYEVLLHHWRLQQAEITRLHNVAAAAELAGYALELQVCELTAQVERLCSALRGIRREFGHMSINNGTSTLGLFVDAVLKNDLEYAEKAARGMRGDP